MAKKRNNNFVTALAYIVIGVLFCLFKATVLDWLMTAVGAIFILQGIVDLIRKNVFNGLVGVVVGIVILLGGWLFVEIVLLVLGVLLAIKGVMALLGALSAKKKNIISILFALLTVVIGVMLVVSKWAMVDTMFIVIGVLLIVDGVMDLIGAR
ncbi:MAG: DUF308 domain-containing protein [Clostridia bacterium]|nr:DUF308 domain-containing protein [Clostridia bacterium]